MSVLPNGDPSFSCVGALHTASGASYRVGAVERQILEVKRLADRSNFKSLSDFTENLDDINRALNEVPRQELSGLCAYEAEHARKPLCYGLPNEGESSVPILEEFLPSFV